jgi:hypothetical protein
MKPMLALSTLFGTHCTYASLQNKCPVATALYMGELDTYSEEEYITYWISASAARPLATRGFAAEAPIW